MSAILMHQHKPSYLVYNDEDGSCTETTEKKKATKFVTVQSAIVVLEDSGFQEFYYPIYARN